MPYARQTLTALRAQVASDITSEQPGADALLRFSPLKITGKVQAGLSHLHYGYVDYVSKQAVPFTATGEYRRAWAALKDVYVKDATQAVVMVSFPGSPGRILDIGTAIARGDGATYTTTATGTVGIDRQVTVSTIADVAGSGGNCDAGSVLTLTSAIEGIQSSGVAVSMVSTGFDQESEDSFFARMINAYQAPVQGGAESDYVSWATDISGVTRAWCRSNGFGPGTVVVYVMLDVSNSSENGFPQGTDGVSSSEIRSATVATGDQLMIANVIYSQRPATALVYFCSPLPNTLNFTITGLSTASTATRAAIKQAIVDVLTRKGSPKGAVVDRSDINSGIAAVPGTAGFVITVLTGTAGGVTTAFPENISSGLGYLPVIGNIAYP